VVSGFSITSPPFGGEVARRAGEGAFPKLRLIYKKYCKKINEKAKNLANFYIKKRNVSLI
jgi:hypothetical protein